MNAHLLSATKTRTITIDGIAKVEYRFLVHRNGECIRLHHDSDGQLDGISWPYGTTDSTLRPKARRLHGKLEASIGWTFPTAATCERFLAELQKRHPKWPVVCADGRGSLAGTKFQSFRKPNNQKCYLFVSLPMPSWFIERLPLELEFTILSGSKEKIAMICGEASAIAQTQAIFAKCGAKESNDILEKWGISFDHTPLVVEMQGWAVLTCCALTHPDHYELAPPTKYKWDAPYPNGTHQQATLWDGVLKTTRRHWPAERLRFDALGLSTTGDDPTAPIALPAEVDVESVPGWSQPAFNGYLLHEFQKEGVLFCAERGMCAMIADEMGIGKTAQALAATQAIGAKRVFVICPKSARYVWDREIQGWCGPSSTIQHIRSQTDALDDASTWHILTLDQLVSRQETWTFEDADEEQAVLKACPDLRKGINAKRGNSKRKVQIPEFIQNEPALSQKRLDQWRKMMSRLQGALLQQILEGGPAVVIIDEAHRAKNIKSKRAQAVEQICARRQDTSVLLLTGTPLRNNEHEAAALLRYLDPQACEVLSKKNGYSIQDVKDYLSYFMIRRTKAEVLPELPEKTRQRVDLDGLDPEDMKVYGLALESAYQTYMAALEKGRSEAEARNSMRGGIERARSAMGLAKVRGGQVAELVAGIVEDKGCCVVFCAHHAVSDLLHSQLLEMKLSVGVLDGRTPDRTRTQLVSEFRDGGLDVFIGGINAAGESIDLTRSDSVVFVELDWTPAALVQAEDRIHRMGQRRNCQIFQLIARLEDDDSSENLDETMIQILGSKMRQIGLVLDEDENNVVVESVGTRAEVVSNLLMNRKWHPTTKSHLAT
jgi:hypothetical protein